MWAILVRDWERHRRRFCVLNYMFLVLRPSPDAIMLNFLTANLPYCFVQLRTLLEQLGKCFLADVDYRDESSYQDKLRKLEGRMRSRKPSLTKVVSSLGEQAAELYRNLSEDWVHMKSFERITTVMTQKGVPAYAISVLMPYGPTDLADISELGKSVALFRQILAPTLQKWKTEVFQGSQHGPPTP